FFPAGQLEMMVKRKHHEKSFTRELETHHLQNHRDGFDDEDSADHPQKQLLFAANRDDAHHAADGYRPGVTHQNFSWATVKPEKTQARADECRADHRQLSSNRVKSN